MRGTHRAIGRGHKIDDKTDADGGGHVPAGKEGDFPNNVMRRTAGDYTEFTDAQVEKMKQHKYDFGKCTSQFEEAYPAIKLSQQFGAQTDSMADQVLGAPGYLDIHQTIMNSLAGVDEIRAVLSLHGDLPTSGQISVRYMYTFDTDANPATGVAVGEFAGVERGVMVDVFGDLSLGPLTVLGRVLDFISGSEMPLPSQPGIGDEFELVDHPDGAGHELPDGCCLGLGIPKSLLGLTATDIPVGVLAGDLVGYYDSLALDFDLEKWLKDPTLQTFGDGKPTPGQPYKVAISGLKPNDPFSLFIDDTPVLTGTLDPTGGWVGDFVWPSDMPGGFHFLTAQDSTGEFAYSFSCPEPGTFGFLAVCVLAALRRRRAV